MRQEQVIEMLSIAQINAVQARARKERSRAAHAGIKALFSFVTGKSRKADPVKDSNLACA